MESNNALSTDNKTYNLDEIVKTIIHDSNTLSKSISEDAIDRKISAIKTRSKYKSLAFNEQVVTPAIWDSFIQSIDEIKRLEKSIHTYETKLDDILDEFESFEGNNDPWIIKIFNEKRNLYKYSLDSASKRLTELQKKQIEYIKLLGYKEGTVKSLIQINNIGGGSIPHEFPDEAHYRHNENLPKNVIDYISEDKGDIVDIVENIKIVEQIDNGDNNEDEDVLSI